MRLLVLGSTPPAPTDWDTITYTYDPAGRRMLLCEVRYEARVKKNVDGSYIVKYVYDGGHVIAEYDGSNNLLRKYVYGARVDEPVCMIECGQSGASPVSHWKLDEGQGQTAYDSAGSNDGTITGATWTTGKFGGALDFDGDGDYVDFGNVLSQTSNFTAVAWINLAATFDTGWVTVLGKWNDAPENKQYVLAMGSGATYGYACFYVKSSNGVTYSAIGTTPQSSFVGKWYQVVGVFDALNSDIRLYIDSVLEDTTDTVVTTLATTTREFQIGSHTSGTAYWNGTIDDVRIYDRALSEQEIQQLYDGQGGEIYYYHFDGLGSVVALSNSYGVSCQSYQYSVYGQVAASDPNFLANPYMFTGRRFDIETGLYYYRARYYNPHIGRFMQTDPVGDGMKWYVYCGNNPLIMVDPSGCHEMAYHHFHFTMPSELIDTTGLSLDKIPGEFSDWLLSDMAIVDQMPGWDIDSVTWVPDSDEFLDVAIFYNGCYVTDPLPVDEPDLAIENVGGTKILTVNDVGFLDDRTLKNIMDPWFAEKLAMDRWNLNIADWYDDVRNCAVTPFRGSVDEEKHLVIVKQWKYRGEIYDNTEVNYVGFGFGAAHFLCPLHLSARFRVMNRNWPQLWNLMHYQHLAGADQLWFNKGWSLYPGWKPKLIF